MGPNGYGDSLCNLSDDRAGEQFGVSVHTRNHIYPRKHMQGKMENQFPNNTNLHGDLRIILMKVYVFRKQLSSSLHLLDCTVNKYDLRIVNPHNA